MLRNILIYISIYIGLFTCSYYLLSFLSHKKKYKKIPENKLPEVSIIIPAYNEEEGIRDTIISALNLDYPANRLEVIMVDDGSKDKTYAIARKIKDRKLRIFRKENAGKASALNFGLKRAKGKIIVTMDADTFAEKDSLKKMVTCFSSPKVMCVAPSIAIYKPRGILQRVQQIEYFLGVYLRKTFSSMQAIHVTPGAFSAYRKSFFKKYGEFMVGGMTEDMEMALRIQSNNFIIEHKEDAVVYTKPPSTFLSLLRQRRRWYFGLTKNLWHYRRLFSREYGQLGLIVLPVAIITIFLSILLTSYMLISSLLNLKQDLMLLESINFDFTFISINRYVFERYLFILISNPIFLFLVLFILILIAYMFFAKSKVKKYSNIKLSIIFFLMFFSLLFAFWWIVSFFYIIFVRKVSWGKG